MPVSFINERQKVDNIELGNDVILGDFVNLYGCTIGDRTKIGTFIEIQKNVSIGSDCKIQSHTFICEGVKIGNSVFVGHNVSFINDRHPRSVDDDGIMISSIDEWELEGVVVEDNVSIGTSVTIMGGCHIGQGAVIGAGALVLNDIPAGATAVGSPAKIIKLHR